MCKQEDYLKQNGSTCTTKIFLCHASNRRPKPCRALGKGPTGRSRFPSDVKLRSKPGVMPPQQNKKRPQSVVGNSLRK